MDDSALPEVFKEIYLIIKLHWQSSNGGAAGDPPDDLPIFDEIYDFTARTLLDRVAAQIRDPSSWKPEHVRRTGQDIGMPPARHPTSHLTAPPVLRAEHAKYFSRDDSSADDSPDEIRDAFHNSWKRKASRVKSRGKTIQGTNKRFPPSKVSKSKSRRDQETYQGQRRSKRLKMKKKTVRSTVT